jgi:hypothetical protein
MNKDYLGDSVYVESDDTGIKLTTDNGSGPSNTIIFEVEVLEAFIRWCQRHGYIAPR